MLLRVIPRERRTRALVELFVNLPGMLRNELDSRRRRTLPGTVIFNTATDCFQPHPDILEVTYQAMVVLLERGIGISFLTKGYIPQRFIELFRAHREGVLAGVGLVSLAEGYWRSYEQGAAPPAAKLENIEGLLGAGIDTEVRIDPIIPFVTDTREELGVLFQTLGRTGIRGVSVSYLHLRPAIQRQLGSELSPLHRRILEGCFGSQAWAEVGTSTKTKLVPKKLREKGYNRVKAIARAHGISAAICRCKNPDIDGDICLPSRGRRPLATARSFRGRQLALFPC